MSDGVRPVIWSGGAVRLLDQRKLPDREVWMELRDADEVARAIRSLAVRGAPAIGIAAGFAMALAAEGSAEATSGGLVARLEVVARSLIRSRPTAVNLAWAVRRVIAAAADAEDLGSARRAATREAQLIAEEEERAHLRLAAAGEPLIPSGANVLTHCNTGALATAAGFGSALGVIHAAHLSGKGVHVWVDETRPLLQGARLTAWELQRLGIPMTLVADAAAGYLMVTGRVDVVIVGADRIAANGDTANKIGTYPLALLSREHSVPFYVAAPTSSVDPGTRIGDAIEVEMRGPEEVVTLRGVRFAPPGTSALNPAFDVTPARLITAIVTERGVLRPPYGPAIERTLRKPEVAAS
jgi:methylthioribose-1-phosphate isomerase